MPFEQGHKKARGRPKGKPNQDKRLVREIVEAALGKSIPERLIELAQKDPAQEPAILQSLMPYAYSKLLPAPAPNSGESAPSEAVVGLAGMIEGILSDAGGKD